MGGVTHRRLFVIRHAKTEHTAATDSARALTDRGHRQATDLGGWLADQDLQAPVVLVSPATRTRQTWHDAVTAASSLAAIDVRNDAEMYDGGLDAVLDLVRGVPDAVAEVLLVGHNPVMASLAHQLHDGTESAASSELERGFAPASVAVLALSAGWAALNWGDAELVEVQPPRQ